MAMPRLLATDLDGTLLRTDGTVSERTRRALDDALASGVVVVLVTGRPPHTLKKAAQAAGLSGLAVCSNGAIVYDLDRDEIVRHTPLPVESARGVILALRDAVPDVCFAFVRGTRFACEPAYHGIARAVDHADGFLDLAVLGGFRALARDRRSRSASGRSRSQRRQRHPSTGRRPARCGDRAWPASPSRAWLGQLVSRKTACCHDTGARRRRVVPGQQMPRDIRPGKTANIPANPGHSPGHENRVRPVL